MNFIQSPGIVLSSKPLKESDILLTILTETNGCIKAVAPSAKKSFKRFMGGIDIFDCAVFNLRLPAKRAGLYRVEAISKSESWMTLRTDLNKLSLSTYCLEITTLYAKEDDEDTKFLFRPLFLSLRTIDKLQSNNEICSLVIFYNLILLEISGFSATTEGSNFNCKAEIKSWFQQMLQTKSAILPNNLDLINEGFFSLANYSQELIGREINSAALVHNAMR
ncbi:MAG: DNA repair protein RecO [Proteobacteria bacterium]|nr:DNA repair protein RecO [Pseudomonadota bacterium]